MNGGTDGTTGPDQGLRYELAAVVGDERAVHALAAALPPVPVAALDVPGLALLPVTPGLAAEATPAALCAIEPDDHGFLTGGSPYARHRRAALLTGPESGFSRLRPGLLALVEAASLHARLAYLEADYVARDGRQASAVWHRGRLRDGPLLLGPNEVFEPSGAPITVALRALGVSGRGRRDEFLVAGLDRHRTTAGWAAS